MASDLPEHSVHLTARAALPTQLDNLENLRLETERVAARQIDTQGKIEAYEAASKLPNHQKSFDFKGAYVITEKTLRSIDQQVSKLLGVRLDWTVGFFDNHTIDAGSLDQLLEQPLLTTREIRSLTASASMGMTPPLARFSFRITGSSFTPASLDISARDQALVERVHNLVSEALAVDGRWYWVLFRNSIEIPLMLVLYCLVMALAVNYIPASQTAIIVIGAIAAGAAGLLKGSFVKRVEFAIGYSERAMLRRKGYRKIIGPVLIGGTALAILQTAITNMVFGSGT